MWPGPLSRPALGWLASASGVGHARLELSGAPALDARRLGGLFPPLGSAGPSRRSTARSSCGSSKMSCCGSSRPTRSPIAAPGGSNEVVLGGCPRISVIDSLNPRLPCRVHTQMGGCPGYPHLWHALAAPQCHDALHR